MKYNDALRVEELRLVMTLLLDTTKPGSRILEIGAGTGVQGVQLQNAGFDVAAVDLAESEYADQRVFPIIDYDGINLPFADNEFDLIFSSNVMEHVEDFAALQREQKRVLRAGGKVVHLVPSGVWAACTLISYWLALPRTVYRKLRQPAKKPAKSDRKASSEPGPAAQTGSTFRAIVKSLLKQMFPEPHGVFADNLVAEIRAFSRRNWTHRFESAGWRVEKHTRVNLFYTGQSILGARLSWSARSKLAKLGLGACHCYLLSQA